MRTLKNEEDFILYTDEPREKKLNMFEDLSAIYLEGVQIICCVEPKKCENDSFFRILRPIRISKNVKKIEEADEF